MLKVVLISMNSISLKDVNEAFLTYSFRQTQQTHWVHLSKDLIEIFEKVNSSLIILYRIAQALKVPVSCIVDPDTTEWLFDKESKRVSFLFLFKQRQTSISHRGEEKWY